MYKHFHNRPIIILISSFTTPDYLVLIWYYDSPVCIHSLFESDLHNTDAYFVLYSKIKEL